MLTKGVAMNISIPPTLLRGKSGRGEKTTRKYCRLGKLPSPCAAEHTWWTREDPFVDIWEEVSTKIPYLCDKI